MIIIVQKDKDSGSAELLIDQAGLQYLRKLLNRNWYEPVQKNGGLYDLDHEHLSSADWGGEELTPQYTSDGSERIDSLKIVYLGIDAKKLLS